MRCSLALSEVRQAATSCRLHLPVLTPIMHLLEMSNNHFWAKKDGGGRDAAFGTIVCADICLKKGVQKEERTPEFFLFLYGPHRPSCLLLPVWSWKSAPIDCLQWWRHVSDATRFKIYENIKHDKYCCNAKTRKKTGSNRVARPPYTKRQGSRECTSASETRKGCYSDFGILFVILKSRENSVGVRQA